MPLRRNGFNAANNKQKRQQTADALTDEGGPGHTLHVHMEFGDKEDVHADIREGGAGQEIKRRFGIAKCGENPGCNIIIEDKGQAVYVDVEVLLGRVKQLFRRMNQLQQLVAEASAEHHQEDAERTAGNQRGVDDGSHIVVALRAEQLRDQNGTADVAAERKGQKNQRDFIAVADGGQGVVVDEFPGDKAVRNVVELLEENAAKQGQTEFPEHTVRFPGR